MALVAFRVDASAAMGLGHLSRCLALAAQLRQRGADCHFVAGQPLWQWAALVQAAGHSLSLIDASRPGGDAYATQTLEALSSGPQADWLVVDHYGLDAAWHRRARPAARRLLALDDLANRPLAVDAVLDPSPCADEAAYRTLAPSGCELLLGPRYCLLRDEFALARPAQSWTDGPARIHLALGGTDPAAHTLPMATQLLSWFEQISLVILAGSGPQGAAVVDLRTRFPGRVEAAAAAPGRVADTMLGCTCAVGAPGGTLWERFCLGLPTACVTTAPTQRPVVENLARAGWLLDLGEAADFSATAHDALRRWLGDEGTLNAQRRFLMSQVDGQGALRVAAWMMEAV